MGPPVIPIHDEVAGVKVVTIPLTHYAELLECQRRLAAVEITPQRVGADLRSRIDRDPEVAAFLTECFGRMLLKAAVSACRERFGSDRAPAQSTVQRFWSRLRENSDESASGKTGPGGRG